MTGKKSKGAVAAARMGNLRFLDPARADGFRNNVTGFGTAADKTTHGYYVAPHLLRDQQLANVYHSHDLAARIVDIVPGEMMREPWEVDLGDADASGEVDERLEALGTREHFLDGARWGRLYGGAATIVGCDDGRPSWMPLRAERADDVDFLFSIDKRYLVPIRWYDDPASGKLGRPETYMVTSPGRTRIIGEVHESRMVLWPGASTSLTERQANLGWDYSVLQRSYEVLRTFDEVWHSVELMSVEASQTVYKVAGMLDMMTGDDPSGSGLTGKQLIESRMQFVDFYRSTMRAVLMDAGSKDQPAEEFDRNQVSFAGVPDVLDRTMLRLCACARVPATIMFGMSPAGLNATGESDMRWFYDLIRSDQVNILSPRLRRLVKVFLATRAGRALALGGDAKVKVKFKALWSETPGEVAKARLDTANADKVYVDAGVLLPEEVALSRFRPDGFAQEIQLDDASRKAREESLESELAQLAEPEPEPPPLPNVAPPPAGAPGVPPTPGLARQPAPKPGQAPPPAG